MNAPRFHQSQAKVLLTECPAVLKRQLTTERTQSRAMEAGSLLDMLVFGQDDRYEIVDARYRSGPREGQPATDWLGKEAKQQRDEIRARGQLPVLECEVDAMAPTAEAIRERIARLAAEMAGSYTPEVIYQPTLQWTSELGVECEGTPDVVVVVPMRDMVKVCTIDVKHTAFLQPKRFNAQVYAMGWDVQGAAYREAAARYYEAERGVYTFHLDHVILATSSTQAGLPPCARPLDPVYMEVGKRRWEKGQRMWKECLDTDSWPSYSEAPAVPSHFVVRTELEAFESTEFPEES
jgi:hypothetical protein